MNANNKLKIKKKTSLWVLNLIQKKLIKKKMKFGRIRIQNQTRIRIHHPGSGSADPDPHQNDTDPDPHQNDTDPKNCFKLYNKLFVLFFLYVQVKQFNWRCFSASFWPKVANYIGRKWSVSPVNGYFGALPLRWTCLEAESCPNQLSLRHAPR